MAIGNGRRADKTAGEREGERELRIEPRDIAPRFTVHRGMSVNNAMLA